MEVVRKVQTDCHGGHLGQIPGLIHRVICRPGHTHLVCLGISGVIQHQKYQVVFLPEGLAATLVHHGQEIAEIDAALRLQIIEGGTDIYRETDTLQLVLQ